MAAKAKVEVITLPKLDIRAAKFRIVGDSPLIVHNWDEKTKRLLEDKGKGKATVGREARDPEREFNATRYLTENGKDAIKTIAFKSAAVTACTSLGKAVTKVEARQAFHILGDLVEIKGPAPTMRTDMVRVGMGSADVRYRAQYWPWEVTLDIRYNTRVLSVEELMNLFNVAGFGVGVGEWRSEKDGQMGLFHVEGVKS